MGRYNKVGLSYFSLDVHLDDKFKLIEAEYGLKGFAIAVKLLQKIYGEFGYYCEWNSDVALLFGRETGLGGNAVSEIVNSCVKRGLFDSEQFNSHGILTSHGIQKSYVDACEKRKVVDMVSDYILLQNSEIPKNVTINGINVGINAINSTGNQQSKVNKSKVNNSISSISDTTTATAQITVQKYAMDNLSFMSPRAMQELNSFKEDMPDEVILEAIDEACANGARNWAYTRSVLNSYLEAGYRTVGEIRAAREKRHRKRTETEESNNSETERMIWRDR